MNNSTFDTEHGDTNFSYMIGPPPPPPLIELPADGWFNAADTGTTHEPGDEAREGHGTAGYELKGEIKNDTDSAINFKHLNVKLSYDQQAISIEPLGRDTELRRGERTRVSFFKVYARPGAVVNKKYPLTFSVADKENRRSNTVTVEVVIIPTRKTIAVTGVKVLVGALLIGGIATLLSACRKRRGDGGR